ncbi:MAG: M24 family metallopeptidase [Firmicutes bacterium]|nr:M24 family metallopeptidase [Bacillota bacterium]
MTRLEEVLVKEKRLHRLMEELGLQGILLKKQPNFSWFTAGGLNMVGMATEMGVTSLLITRKGRYVIANTIEANRMMQEEGLSELGFELLTHEWYLDREAELVTGVVGDLAEGGADTGFAGTRNLDGEIKRLRYSLTPAEIERYLFLGEKLSAALEKVIFNDLRPGDKESEVAGRLSAELWRERIDPTAFMVAADERAFLYRHPIPTQKKIEKYVMICVNARYKGLITTVTRLVHFGPPPPELLRQMEDNVEIECRMIAATKPGALAADVFQVAVRAYQELGYGDEWQKHHQGGAMGYYARDTRVTAATKEPVEENQAYCWNPSISGTKSEDGFIATSTGPIFITKPLRYPRIEKTVGGITFAKAGLLVLP